MNIIFLMLSMPDLSKNSNMYSELVMEFAKEGHRVFPVAPAVGEQATGIYSENNINVLRVKTLKLLNVNPIKKGIANVLLPYQFKAAIKKYYKDVNFDLIVTPTPPITFVSVTKWLKGCCKAKSYLILRDIFPQNAVDLGLMKKWNPVYWMFRMKEKQLYRMSDSIGCMSQGNIDYILKHNRGINEKKLHILENFQKMSLVLKPNLTIKKKYCIENKFVVIFGGNMGIPQELDNVIALAKKCEEYDDVVFLLIGSGTEKSRLKRIVKMNEVKNIIIKNSIPHDDYQQLVSQCDIGLISLNRKFTIPNIPSKTLSYYNLAIPILASIDENTDYGKELDRSGAGLWSLAGDLESYKKNFDTMYNNKELRKEMGQNGRNYFEQHSTLNLAYNIIINNV